MAGRRVLVLADAVFPVLSGPVVARPGDPAAVLVKGDRVVAVGSRRSVLRDAKRIQPVDADQAAGDAPSLDIETVDLSGCVITPGLINAHVHLQYSCFGDAIPTREFYSWIRAVTALIPEMDADAWRASSRLGALENLRAGVTSVGDIFSRMESLAALWEAGLGGVAFYEVLGPGADEAGRAVAALEKRLGKLARAAADAGVTLGLSPHAPYTSHPVLYAAARRIADRERMPLATHVAETRDEVDVLRDGSGPFGLYLAARRDDFEPPGVGPVRYLDSLGFWAGGRTLAVHAVHATPAELRLLAKRGAAIVTCPSSNATLGAGRADVPAMLKAGLTVAVGSDSLASTARIDVLEELDALTRRHRSLSPARLLEMATRHGAEALGLEPGAGTLAPGAPADLAAFPRHDARPVTLPDRALRRLFAAHPAARALMRRGRWLVEDGAATTVDENVIEADAARASTRLAAQAAAL